MAFLKKMKKLLSLTIVFLFCVTGISCTSGEEPSNLDPNGTTLVESRLNEARAKEIYLKELVLAEDTISEQLSVEQNIEEVTLCRTIYVPQDHIEDFAQHSRISDFFDSDIDLEKMFFEISIGSGIILTLSTLSLARPRHNTHNTPFSNVVIAAASTAKSCSVTGTVVGTLIGGLTGTFDEIDETGRLSATTAFAAAVVNLISLIVRAVIKGGGTLIALAGVALVSAVTAGYNAVKKCTETNSKDVDWHHINWEKLGKNAAKKSIEGATSGYRWGSIIGALAGTINSLLNHFSPYTEYKKRIDHTNSTTSKDGHWSGKRGESSYVRNQTIVCKDGTTCKEVSYSNGYADFGEYSKDEVEIFRMTDDRNSNFKQAYKQFAKKWNKSKFLDRHWTARDVSNYINQKKDKQ